MFNIPVLRERFTIAALHVGNAKNGRLPRSLLGSLCTGIGGGYKAKNYMEWEGILQTNLLLFLLLLHDQVRGMVLHHAAAVYQ
jgi:hypothetical protein